MRHPCTLYEPSAFSIPCRNQMNLLKLKLLSNSFKCPIIPHLDCDEAWKLVSLLSQTLRAWGHTLVPIIACERQSRDAWSWVNWPSRRLYQPPLLWCTRSHLQSAYFGKPLCAYAQLMMHRVIGRVHQGMLFLVPTDREVDCPATCVSPQGS